MSPSRGDVQVTALCPSERDFFSQVLKQSASRPDFISQLVLSIDELSKGGTSGNEDSPARPALDLSLASWILLLLTNGLETPAPVESDVHDGCQCSGCGVTPIRGLFLPRSRSCFYRCLLPRGFSSLRRRQLPLTI